MLNGKQTEQQRINEQCLAERSWCAGIDRLGDKHISHKTYCVEKRYEEDQVTYRPVKESKDATHDKSLLSRLRSVSENGNEATDDF